MALNDFQFSIHHLLFEIDVLISLHIMYDPFFGWYEGTG